MSPIPPPSRFVPAREEWLTWRGPVNVNVDGAPISGSLIGPDTRPESERAGPWTVYPSDDEWPDIDEAYKLARSVATEDIRLDPTRPEVRDMLARALGLPESHRVGEWAAGLCWWAGHRQRALSTIWRKGEQLDIGGPCWRYYADGSFTVTASDAQAMGDVNAVILPTGLLLPPLQPGTAPILWSPE